MQSLMGSRGVRRDTALLCPMEVEYLKISLQPINSRDVLGCWKQQ